MSLLMFLPIALVAEVSVLSSEWSSSSNSSLEIAGMALASGFNYYFYNEVAFFTLSQVSPVTHCKFTLSPSPISITISMPISFFLLSSRGQHLQTSCSDCERHHCIQYSNECLGLDRCWCCRIRCIGLFISENTFTLKRLDTVTHQDINYM